MSGNILHAISTVLYMKGVTGLGQLVHHCCQDNSPMKAH